MSGCNPPPRSAADVLDEMALALGKLARLREEAARLGQADRSQALTLAALRPGGALAQAVGCRCVAHGARLFGEPPFTFADDCPLHAPPPERFSEADGWGG